MTHAPAAARALLASVLSLSALLATAACSVLGDDTAGPASARSTASVPPSATAPTAGQSSPATSEPGLS